MPLYEHKDGHERVRTVPGKHEDARLRESPDWHLVKPSTSAPVEPAGPTGGK